jgi:HEAT repeat protein
MFGPLMFAALLAWGLVAIYSGVEFATPRVENWLEQRRILKALRSPDIKTRQQAVLSLEQQSPEFTRAYLLEPANDPSVDVGIAACRLLANQGADPKSLIPVLSAAADDDQIEVRVETARILGRILARAASEIRSSADSLKSPAVQLRSKCVSILYRLLKDRIGDVRAAAADLLGDGGLDPSVAAELIAAAGDSDRGVRLEIARTLLRINFDVRRAALDLLSIIIEDTRAEMPNQADAR